MDNIAILQGTAKFVSAYGYLAVALVLMGIAWIFYGRGAKIPFYVTGTIGLSFLVIFGSLDLLIRNFPDVVIARPPLLIGRVTGATKLQKFALQTDDEQRPFMKREFDPNDVDKSNYFFIFSRAVGVSCIQMIVSTPEDEKVFAIPIASMPQPHRPDDELFVNLAAVAPDGSHRNPMQRWMRGTQRLTDPVESKTLPYLNEDCTAGPSPNSSHSLLQLLFPSAFAQGTDSIERRLESDDPFIRRSARQSVARSAATSPDMMVNLLRSPNEQTQIGGLMTIAGMPDKSQLGPTVWRLVDGLGQSGNPAVRRAAEQARSGR